MHRHLSVSLAGLLAAAPALAQVSPGAGTPAAQAAAPAAGQRDAAVEQRIADLRTRLKITPSEQKPFDNFVDIMRENARRMDDLVQKRRQTAVSGNAVDQMQAYGAMAQAHADDMQRLVPAFSNLYDALSPVQKKLADQSFREFAQGPRGAARG